MSKESIRKKMLTERHRLDPDWVYTSSITIQQKAMELKFWDTISSVALYMSVAGEVDTGLLREVLTFAKRTIVVPASERDSVYRWCRLEPESELVAGPYDIPQPRKLQPLKLEERSAVIVPGLAFDRSGGRLGHGAGIYDRLLHETPRALRIALAFDWQLISHVPVAENDITMDFIVTEKQTLTCSARARDGMFKSKEGR